jgi:hypothetical protein
MSKLLKNLKLEDLRAFIEAVKWNNHKQVCFLCFKTVRKTVLNGLIITM